MLDIDELLTLEEDLKLELEENLTYILCVLNSEEKLEEFLEMIGLKKLLSESSKYHVYKTGKIVVLGESAVSKSILLGVAKSMGIEKERFELYLDYSDGKKFDAKKIQWNPEYSVVLVGAMGHSGKAKGSYSSVISAMEQQKGYPPIVRMGNNRLKITKSNFRNTLEQLRTERKIA